jgi:hypothetical protein
MSPTPIQGVTELIRRLKNLHHFMMLVRCGHEVDLTRDAVICV